MTLVHRNKNKSFTIIEIAIVAIVLGVLMVAIVSKLNSTVGKARDAVRKKDITLLGQALNMYHFDNGMYPAHVPNPAAGLSGAGLTGINCGGSGCGWETSLDSGWLQSLTKYLTKVPVDPLNQYNANFPWNGLATLTGSKNANMYVYANYASGYVRGSLRNCEVPNYALVGATNFEMTVPGMWPACPGYDRSTLVDYGYVLHKGGTYVEYTSYPIGSSGAVGTGATGAILPPLPTTCPTNAGGNPVGFSQSCYCNSASTAAGNVRGTNTYTHNSAICRTAVHAGVIPLSGGNITRLVTPGQNNYIGSTQNGVTSSNVNNAPRSMKMFFYP